MSTVRTYTIADLHCYYQRDIDWSIAGQSNVRAFIVQISRGGGPLTRMENGVLYTPDSQVAGVRQANKMLGGYHFCTTEGGSPEHQAATFAEELRRYCALDLPPFFDVETTGGFLQDNPLTVEFILRFQRAMRLLGFPLVGLYSNAYFLSKLGSQVVNRDGLLVWIADYGTVAEPRFFTGPHDIWQFNNKGDIPGFGQLVDLSVSDMGFMRFYQAA